MLSDHASNGIVTDFEIELTDQTFGAEAGLFSKFDDLPFQAGRGLVGAALGSAGMLRERGSFTRDKAAQPLSDGVARTAKLSDGGFDAMLTGKANDLLVKPVTISAHTVQFKIAAVHPRKIGTGRLSVRPSAAAAQGAPRSARPAAGELRLAAPAAGPDAAVPQTSLHTLRSSLIRAALNTLSFWRGSRCTQLFPVLRQFYIDTLLQVVTMPIELSVV